MNPHDSQITLEHFCDCKLYGVQCHALTRMIIEKIQIRSHIWIEYKWLTHTSLLGGKV